MGKSESQMDIMEKSSKPGKRRWTVAEIGLSVLLLLVSCALAGLAVLYTSVVKGNGSLRKDPDITDGGSSCFVCVTASWHRHRK